jgi:type II secretory pathway pseudopilin PulG
VIHVRPSSSPTSVSRLRRRCRADAGFSLIEVLVSALLVILIGTATAKALISSSHFSGDQRLRSQADSVANQDQERLRGLSDLQLNDLESTPQQRQVTIGGTTFNVTSTIAYLDTTGNTGCSATAAAYYRVTSTVAWSEAFRGSSQPSIVDQSILSRPVSGDLPVVLTDQTGQPLSGVNVQASGTSPQTATTDSSGCVLFAGLTPGNYNVILTDAGYVDPNGNPSPVTVPTTVTTTGTAAQAVHLGLAGQLTGTFSAATGLTSPNPTSASGEADGISWSGTGSSYAMSSPLTNTASSPQTQLATDSLFPFSGSSGYTNNYTVWAGQCPQQRPPAGIDAFTVSPGSNQSVNIAEPLLKLSFTFGGGSVQPGHVKLTFQSATGASCSDSWSPAIAATAGSTGWLAHPGQPYADGTTGTLSVCVDYTNVTRFSRTTYTQTVPVTNTNFTGMNPASVALTTSSARGSC